MAFIRHKPSCTRVAALLLSPHHIVLFLCLSLSLCMCVRVCVCVCGSATGFYSQCATGISSLMPYLVLLLPFPLNLSDCQRCSDGKFCRKRAALSHNAPMSPFFVVRRRIPVIVLPKEKELALLAEYRNPLP